MLRKRRLHSEFYTRESQFVRIGKKAADDQIFELDVNESLRVLFNSMFSYLKMGTAIPRELVELKFKELQCSS